MQCPQCQHGNASAAKFCNQCGTPFAPMCSACKRENAADAKFCNQCGAPLMAPASAPASVQFMPQEAESERRFQALLLAIMGLLQREKRVPYRTLKYVFDINEVVLAEVRENLGFRQLAYDEDGKGLVWTGEALAPVHLAARTSGPSATTEATAIPSPAVSAPPLLVTMTATQTHTSTPSPEDVPTDVSPDEPVVMPEAARSAPEAERRQLTVMFCDLVGSTDLSGTLDPEDLREVVRAYQETAAEVIERYQGHIAQYLGDGLLIYFGFPVAHEDDAQRAVYTGLGIPEAIATLNTRLETQYGVQLAVRIGIHTGQVVVGEMGSGARHENLALGETPNLAARLEGLAPPNTAVLSAATAQLVQRTFVLHALGTHALKGVAEPMRLYTVVSLREAEFDDPEALLTGGFDTLVGRDEEIGLLLRRWQQSKEGLGHVVLISGEAGIGKSSLVEGLRRQVGEEGLTRVAFRGSPYYRHSAFYPMIVHVQRVLDWQPGDSVETRLAKLEQALGQTTLALEEAVPLLAALLSLSLPDGRYAALHTSPQQQRQQTQDVLVEWLSEEAARQPVLAVWEDLHWAGPSTLETLELFVEQAPTAAMLHVLTFRPEFEPPWAMRSHLTPLTLNRLERAQVEALVGRQAGDKGLPAEVVAHIVAKTDGVPLYVEELTKMLLASELLREEAEAYVLTGPLLTVAIPDTLQDSLMARLDQMNTAKEVAQLGSVLGREFTYEMLQAISSQDEETLQAGLGQLVAAELLYQQGRPPRAKYLFKHALIQDTAYASLLRSTRQRVHRQIAELLEAHFPETVERQPEVVAHHYTEAGLHEPAIGYWRQAGQRAGEQSAHREAINHLTKGLELIALLPDKGERPQQELDLQMALGRALMTTQGTAGPDVERVYARARQLCQQVGETPQLFPVLWGLCRYYTTRGELQTARELEDQLLRLAQRQGDPDLLVTAHNALGNTLFYLGELASARTHLEEGAALYDPRQHHIHALQYVQNPGLFCLGFVSWALWCLGYPEQALHRSQQARIQAQELGYPAGQAMTLYHATRLHHLRRDVCETRELAEASMIISAEHGIANYLALGTFLRGWALFQQGQGGEEEAMAQMCQGLAAIRATGNEVGQPMYLALLAEAYGKSGQADEGFSLLTEAWSIVDKSGQSYHNAEIHRIEGELRLQQSAPDTAQAEACLQQALDVARQQEAKSWELRAALSLARLWQQQDKRAEARELLAPVYNWFTEGFDTADLQEAQGLLDELEP